MNMLNIADTVENQPLPTQLLFYNLEGFPYEMLFEMPPMN